MSDEAEDLLQRVLQLPDDEQREFAARLLRRLAPDPAVLDVWYDEAERRLADHRAGGESIPWDDVRRELLGA